MLHSSQVFIEHYGYLGIGLLVAAENAGLPLPGETALILGGAFAAGGTLSPLLVAVVGAVGAIIGDNIGFIIGRYAGYRVLLKYGSKIGITQAKYERIAAFFRKWGGPGVLVARFLPIMRYGMAPVLGGMRYPWLPFILWQAAGAILWASCITCIGYYGLLAIKH
jgi:membrane protein DedA with SNARE-associated domain